MIIKKGHIEVSRTAYYYISGEVTHKTKEIWFVLHGYGQTGGEFILNFRELINDSRLIIAPEGLSKFYLKSGTGETGASWMTKDDRESEIKCYVDFLDNLFAKEVKPYIENYKIKIVGFGFSQGCATLTRWLALGRTKFDRSICWCGSIAEDIDYTFNKNLIGTDFHLVYGKKDTLISPSYPIEQSHFLLKQGIESHIHYFEGGHELNPHHLVTLNFDK